MKGNNMNVFYEIDYMVDGIKYSMAELPMSGLETWFPEQVLNRLESLAMGGAVITRIERIVTK